MAHIAMVLVGDIRYDGRVRKEISTLVTAGHHIELVVSDFSRTGSGGEDLGIKIHYIPMTLWGTPAMNFLEQILFNRRAAALIRNLSPTHVHCHDLTSLLAGVWAKNEVKVELVFDAHELMPESMGGIRKRVWDKIEKKCIDHCDYIIMPEKNRIAYFKQKYPKIGEVLLLENFPRKMEIPCENDNLFRQIYPISEEQKIILHSGLIAAKRHVEELVESMALCSDQFVLVLLGMAFKGYDEMLREKIKNLGLVDRVYLHPAVLNAEILRYMASCDIGTAFYENTNLNNLYCASNKLFEYIALSKPVLTNKYPGLLERVESFRQGVCLDDITPANLVKAYVHACDRSSITPGNKHFFWEEQEEVIVRLYDSDGDNGCRGRSLGMQAPRSALRASQ